jgi:hypothetical protein
MRCESLLVQPGATAATRYRDRQDYGVSHTSIMRLCELR